MKTSTTIITAIVSITLMQIAAFYYHLDGNLLLASVATVGGLAGYSAVKSLPKP